MTFKILRVRNSDRALVCISFLIMPTVWDVRISRQIRTPYIDLVLTDHLKSFQVQLPLNWIRVLLYTTCLTRVRHVTAAPNRRSISCLTVSWSYQNTWWNSSMYRRWVDADSSSPTSLTGCTSLYSLFALWGRVSWTPFIPDSLSRLRPYHNMMLNIISC